MLSLRYLQGFQEQDSKSQSRKGLRDVDQGESPIYV